MIRLWSIETKKITIKKKGEKNTRLVFFRCNEFGINLEHGYRIDLNAVTE